DRATPTAVAVDASRDHARRRSRRDDLPRAVERAAEADVTLPAKELRLAGEADVLEADVQREPIAMRDRAATSPVERGAHRRKARLRRSVGVVHARLPAEQRGLVLGVEEEDARHVRLAEREPEP